MSYDYETNYEFQVGVCKDVKTWRKKNKLKEFDFGDF